MKYDVFISYARKDFDEVNRFVEMLKERIPSLTCWFDITGIESGDEFEDKIITAIDNSTYVLFALSDHSIQSQWTKDEVMYAKNSNKKVIPLLLKGAQLKGWFLFKFGRIDCIDTTNSLQIDKLVKNLSDWTGKRVVSASASEAKPNPSEVPEHPKKEYVKKELHEAVDLGLSVKWATCNVGAASPSDYGEYFAWGETEPKKVYWEKTYKHCINKYKNIGKNISGTEYDVARTNWGGNWRLPTMAECRELVDKCTWIWTTQNGHNGYKVVGSNGHSIFLPAASLRYGTSLIDAGEYGDYWSSAPGESYAQSAYYLYFDSSSHDVGCYYRYCGQSVRPVSE